MDFMIACVLTFIIGIALSKVPVVEDSCLPSVNNPTYVVTEKCD